MREQSSWYLSLTILLYSLLLSLYHSPFCLSVFFKTDLLVSYIKLVLIFSNRIRHSLSLHPLHFIIPLFITQHLYGLYNYDLHV